MWPAARVDAAADALREAVDRGPTSGLPSATGGRSLAAYPAGLALALTAMLAIGAMRRRRTGAGHMSEPAPNAH